MTPDDIQLLVADLVRADVDADLIGRVAAAFVGMAEAAASAPVSAARSKGAERTARWRARKRLAASQASHVTAEPHGGDGGDGPVMGVARAESPGNREVAIARADSAGPSRVSEASPRDGSDGAAAKEGPPHPLKKTTTPKPPVARQRHGGVTRQRSAPRFGVAVETPIADPERAKVRVPGDTPLHFELLRLHPDRRIPETGASGWFWSAEQIAEAQQRLGAVVVSLPVSVDAARASMGGGEQLVIGAGR